MASFPTEQIRNIVLVGHGGCGKTSLAEAMLFKSGATTRLGSVDGGTSSLDFEPEEQKRGGSIATSLGWCVYNDTKLNILDTPGDQNFIYDAFNAMLGADAAVVVVGAPDGIEVQTERVWRQAELLGLPRTVFINKMDRERADPAGCVADLEETLGVEAIPVQVPVGREGGFRGVVSLFQKQAFIFDDKGDYTKQDVPAELEDEVEAAWEKLVEAVASSDDELLEEYLETFELSDEQVRKGFRAAIKKGSIVPVLYGAATSCIGAVAVMEVASWAFPSPLERGPLTRLVDGDEEEEEVSASGTFTAQIIHTTVDEFSGKASIFRIFSGKVPSDAVVWNPNKEDQTERIGSLFTLRGKERTQLDGVTGDIVAVAKLKVSRTGDTLSGAEGSSPVRGLEYPPPMMTYAIRPAGKGDETRIKQGLERILEEDPTLSVGFEALTGQMVLRGMGEAHLDMAIDRMARKFKVNVESELPPVPYRETLRKPVGHVEGKHKKQTGGAGQFGVCYLDVEPLTRDSGFEFENKIVGGAIPRQYIPSVEKGIMSRMKNGFLAGYPIVDIGVRLVDGKYHPVDSKDVAYQMAGSKGLKAAFEKGGTVLLEPIMDMEIVTPTEVMGDVMGDVSSRRGRVLGMEPRGKNTVIKAQVPMSEVQQYAPLLKGMTAGKGSFTMTIGGYEEVPRNLVDSIVASSPFKRDDDD